VRYFVRGRHALVWRRRGEAAKEKRKMSVVDAMVWERGPEFKSWKTNVWSVEGEVGGELFGFEVGVGVQNRKPVTKREWATSIAGSSVFDGMAVREG
jgi:hypothetical protein